MVGTLATRWHTPKEGSNTHVATNAKADGEMISTTRFSAGIIQAIPGVQARVPNHRCLYGRILSAVKSQ